MLGCLVLWSAGSDYSIRSRVCFDPMLLVSRISVCVEGLPLRSGYMPTRGGRVVLGCSVVSQDTYSIDATNVPVLHKT